MSRTPARDALDAAGIEAICERIAECEPLRQIATSYGVGVARLMDWLAREDHVERYTRAREAQADRHAEEILRIADDRLNDTYTDDQGNTRTDQEVVARSRLRVDARKWLAAKMRPKVYGDRLIHDGEVGVRALTDEQLQARLADLSERLGVDLAPALPQK